MAGNNIKLLTDRQLIRLKEKYSFSYDGENVVVSVNDYNRKTKHPIDQPFSINSKIRKVTFSVDAISIWLELSQDNFETTLLDVQNALNKLQLMYQPMNYKNVKKILSGVTSKITNL